MKNTIIILFGCYFVYLSQNVFPKSLSSICFIFMFIISLGYTLISFTNRTDSMTKRICCFYLLNIVYYILFHVFSVDNLDSALNTVKKISLGLLFYYPFYYVGRQNVKLESIFNVFYLLFLIYSIFSFFTLKALLVDVYESEYTVNNIGYNFVLLLPMLLLVNKNVLIKLLLLSISVIFVVLSAKRGALICLVGFVLVYCIYSNKMYSYFRRGKLLIFGVLLIAISVFFVVSQNNPYLLERFYDIEGSQSGRDIIRKEMLFHVKQHADVGNIIWGFGFNATLNEVLRFAHNDWLEVLFDYGLVGLSVYVCMIWSFYKSTKKTNNLTIRYTIIAVLVCWVLQSVTTGVFTGIKCTLLTSVLGYCQGCIQGECDKSDLWKKKKL